MIFIDTDVAVALRDNHFETQDRIAELASKPVISIITRIELEHGAMREPALAELRRRMLDRVLATLQVEDFVTEDITAYGRIVLALGFSRTKTFDRLIAAQAMTRRATLITRNGDDFRSIPGLELDVWPPM